MVAHVCARVWYGWVAHGWNINELSTGKHMHLIDPLWGCGVCVGYWLWLHGVVAVEYAFSLGVLDRWWWCCVVCMVWHAVGF